MKNNLINDPSPYLQQHKDNPVFWQAWNNEALLLAKKEKKPTVKASKTKPKAKKVSKK